MRIIYRLKKTFIERDIVERAKKAETRLEEQCEKTVSCSENLWSEIQLKGSQRQKQTQEKNRMKRSEPAWLLYVFDKNRNIPTTCR